MKTILVAIRTLLTFTLLTGMIYPLFVTGVANFFWHEKANGSLIYSVSGDVVGSELIAQKFSSSIYFWPRPSSAGKEGYDASASSGSNWGATSADLKSVVDSRLKSFDDDHNVPPDLIFSSGSGLDPHISVLAANYQISRVSSARHLTGEQTHQLQNLVETMTESRSLGFLGEERINVLKLNLALDKALGKI